MGKLIIISGGPGSGKTTLLDQLRKQGYKTYDEVPRFLIEKNLKENNDLLPWVNLPDFARLCHGEMMKQKNNQYGTAFVDRAIGDIIAYLQIGSFCGDEYRTDAAEGYSKSVFLLRPHRDIYIQDEVRPHSFEEAIEIHDKIRKVYTSLGFTIVEIPHGKVDSQVAIIKREMGL
jgi:predicted ATPase